MKKTLLIVGAGASCEYGLPCGSKLVDWILENGASHLMKLAVDESDAHSERHREILRAQSRQPIDQFVATFRNAATRSIDEFLKYQPTHRNLARLAITRCLLEKEAEAIASSRYTTGFYPALVERLGRPDVQCWPSDLDVITFNYDRTLEYIAATTYAGRIGTQHSELALDAVATHTTHVYGSFTMGYVYDRQAHRFVPQNRWSRGPIDRRQIPRGEYSESSKGILVIGEDRPSASDDLQARVRFADRIVFLGFGFDESNLKLLGIDRGEVALKQDCAVHATGFGLKKSQRRQLTEMFPKIQLGDNDVGCAGFVNDELEGLGPRH